MSNLASKDSSWHWLAFSLNWRKQALVDDQEQDKWSVEAAGLPENADFGWLSQEQARQCIRWARGILTTRKDK